MRSSSLALAIALMLGRSAIGSELLYDNGPPNRVDAYEITAYVRADDFRLTAPARLEAVKFWSAEDGVFDGSIVWEIFANGANNYPGALLSSGTSSNPTRAATGFNTLQAPEYTYTFAITPIGLPAGTYWLALHHGPLSSMSNRYFYWETTAKNGSYASKGLVPPFTGSWQNNASTSYTLSSEFAFQLFGTSGPRIEAFSLERTAAITFPTLVGYVYGAEYKDSIDNPKWLAAGGATVQGTGTFITLTTVVPASPYLGAGFYRITLAQGALVPTITDLALRRAPVIRFTALTGKTYRVEYAEAVDSTVWAPLPGAEMISGTGKEEPVIDKEMGASNLPRRFYRLVLL